MNSEMRHLGCTYLWKIIWTALVECQGWQYHANWNIIPDFRRTCTRLFHTTADAVVVEAAVAEAAAAAVVAAVEGASSMAPYVVLTPSYRLRASTRPTSFYTAASLTTPRWATMYVIATYFLYYHPLTHLFWWRSCPLKITRGMFPQTEALWLLKICFEITYILRGAIFDRSFAWRLKRLVSFGDIRFL